MFVHYYCPLIQYSDQLIPDESRVEVIANKGLKNLTLFFLTEQLSELFQPFLHLTTNHYHAEI